MPEPVPHSSDEARARHQGTSLILEEAYALLAAGQAGDAARALADAQSLLDDRAAAALQVSVELALARLADGSAAAASVSASLRALAERVPQERWRIQLELARSERRGGRTHQAAALLKQSLEAFRERAGELGAAAPALARIISREVAKVESSARSEGAPREPARDSSLDEPTLLKLVDLGKRLAAESDPEEVLRMVLHEAIELLEADRGFVVRMSGAGTEFALAENLDRSEIDEPAFEISHSLIRDVVGSGAPAFLSVPEVPASHPASQSLAQLGVVAVACIPIRDGSTSLGVLYLDRRQATSAPWRHSERLLNLFAGQAAAALRNAEAHREKARALETAEEALRRQRSESERRARYRELVGASDVMQDVYKRLDRIVPTEMSVLLLGESGTGKDVAARIIHERGPRREREFVAINCAGLADTLLESELFGYERGAFTGADRTRPGLFEIANRGTLFLDEVGDTSPRMQADLLRVLQSGEVRRVGGRQAIQVDVRVIAATHRDLEERVRSEEFRQDLYFRLNVLNLRLPPLRERADDVPLLCEALLRRIASDREPPRLAVSALRKLQAYSWPGNVRELENVLRRLSVLGVSPLEEKHLPPEILRPAASERRAGTLRDAEREAVRQALLVTKGNKARAARILGIDRKTLYAKLEAVEEPRRPRRQREAS